MTNQYIVFFGPIMALYTPADLFASKFATLEFEDGSTHLQAEICAYSELEFVCVL